MLFGNGSTSNGDSSVPFILTDTGNQIVEIGSLGFPYGLRLSVVKNGIRDIQGTVWFTNTLMTIGIPGYVVPVDQTVQLYVFYSGISKVESEGNAFKITRV